MVSPEYIVDAHFSWVIDQGTSSEHDPGQQMRSLGMSGTVVIQPHHDFDESIRAVNYALEEPSVLGVIPWIDLSSSSLQEQLITLQKYPKVRGVVLSLEDEDNHWLVKPEVIEGLRAVADLGWSADLMVEPRQLPAVKSAATQVPNLRFGLAHMGSPFIGKSEREPWGVFMLNIAPLPNVFIKASGLVTLDSSPWNTSHIKLFVEPIIRMFGHKKIMFGSDWPHYRNVASFDEVLDATVQAASPMTEPQLHRLLGGTAREFYQL